MFGIHSEGSRDIVICLPRIHFYSPNIYGNRFGKWNEVLEAFTEFQKTGKCKIITNGTLKNHRNKNKRKAISKSLRYDILKRDNFKCRGCGSSPATNPLIILHVDHIIPLSKGGETTPDNLQTLCSDCNLGKGAKQ
jgi:HNH endonuclease